MNNNGAQELTRLLNQVAAENSYLPTEESYRAIHKIIPWPAVEVLIINPQDQTQFLLTYRDDGTWKGWHIPGGFVRWPDQSLLESCRKIARKELGEGFSILDAKLLMAHKWTDHPYGAPVSLVYVCTVDKEPKLSGTVKFFNEIPPNTIRQHVPFLEKYLQTTQSE